MARLEDFKDEPAKKNHEIYKDSLFTFTAPEYSTAEVLLSSTYRKLLLNLHDKDIDLDDITDLTTTLGQRWNNANVADLLFARPGSLASPIRSGQKGAVPYRQLTPLVPQIARYAGVLGKPRNRWFPGDLLLQAIGTGYGTTAGNALIQRLQIALAISSNDGVFSRFVAQEIDAIAPPGPMPTVDLSTDDVRAFRGAPPATNGLSPAEQCCRDLDLLLPLKNSLTRRQWTVLLEAMLRLGLPTHVLWVCQLNTLVWNAVLAVASGASTPTLEQIDDLLWRAHRQSVPFLEIGRDSVPAIKQLIEKYVCARFGLNLLLYRLEAANAQWPTTFIGHDPTTTEMTSNVLYRFLQHVGANRAAIHPTDAAGWLRAECHELADQHLSLLRCTSGFTKNLFEFVRHSLGQIEALDAEQRSYDQSYLLSNSVGRRRRSRFWPVQPGPGMLIVLAHSACNRAAGIPVSMDDFRDHLANYGLHMPPDELVHGRVTTELQKLGLLVDSPDAAGGRLLVSPFATA